jgi:hypothetical protein
MQKVLFALALLLAGCATQPPTPLPYHFVLADVADARPAVRDGGTDPLFDVYPLSTTAVGLGVINSLPYSLYGAREARLHLKVTHYQATSDQNGAYALSIGLEGTAEETDSTKPQVIARFSATCSQVEREGFALDAIATEVVQEKSIHPLTPAGRDKRMWQKLMNGCTHDLASQLATSVVAP